MLYQSTYLYNFIIIAIRYLSRQKSLAGHKTHQAPLHKILSLINISFVSGNNHDPDNNESFKSAVLFHID